MKWDASCPIRNKHKTDNEKPTTTKKHQPWQRAWKYVQGPLADISSDHLHHELTCWPHHQTAIVQRSKPVSPRPKSSRQLSLWYLQRPSYENSRVKSEKQKHWIRFFFFGGGSPLFLFFFGAGVWSLAVFFSVLGSGPWLFFLLFFKTESRERIGRNWTKTMYDAFCVGNTSRNPPGREGSQACATTSGRQASTAAHAVHDERRQSMSCASGAAGESASSQPWSKSVSTRAGHKGPCSLNLSAGAKRT